MLIHTCGWLHVMRACMQMKLVSEVYFCMRDTCGYSYEYPSQQHVTAIPAPPSSCSCSNNINIACSVVHAVVRVKELATMAEQRASKRAAASKSVEMQSPLLTRPARLQQDDDSVSSAHHLDSKATNIQVNIYAARAAPCSLVDGADTVTACPLHT